MGLAKTSLQHIMAAGAINLSRMWARGLKIPIGKTRISSFAALFAPAFYSTLAASHDITLAGSLERIEKFKALTRQVAATEKVLIVERELQPLYEGTVLK